MYIGDEFQNIYRVTSKHTRFLFEYFMAIPVNMIRGIHFLGGPSTELSF